MPNAQWQSAQPETLMTAVRQLFSWVSNGRQIRGE
jgi:hypothetical protein